MKLLVALVILAVALKSTGGQMMEENEVIFDINPGKIMKDMYKSTTDFLEEKTDTLNIDPGQLGMIIANMLPNFNPVPKMAKFYGKFCGTNNCNETGLTCLEFLIPPEVCKYHKECIPDAMRAMFSEEGPKKAMKTCYVKKMAEHHNAAYQEGDRQGNLRNILEMMITNNGSALTETAKNNLRDAFNGLCQFPPEEYCITDVIKFAKCALNSCVSGMHYP